MGTDLIVERSSEYSVMDHDHIHPQYEIYFCTENVRQKSIINGVEYSYKFPCVIISKPYSIHSMSCDEAVDLFERYVVYFSLNEELFKQLAFPDILSDAKMGLLFELTGQQAQYLKKLFELFKSDADASITKQEGYLLISFFINRLFDFCQDGKITKIGSSEFYIQDVLRYISENLSHKITVSDVARNFAVSRSKLERDFRQATSRTPHEYIDMCRINQAKIMLSSKEPVSISEVSGACGFSSETYFFPFFQNKVGLSPAEYRRKKLEEKGTVINKTKNKIFFK